MPLSPAVCCRPCLPTSLPHTLTTRVQTRIDLPATAGQGVHNTTLQHHSLRGSSMHRQHTEESVPRRLNASKSGCLQADANGAMLAAAQHRPFIGQQIVPAAQVFLHGEEHQEHGEVHEGQQQMQRKQGPLPSPSSPPGTISPKPVAIISVGCHPTSGRSYKALSCEPGGSSFVTGFSQANHVNAYYQEEVFYPLGNVSWVGLILEIPATLVIHMSSYAGRMRLGVSRGVAACT